MDNEMRAIDSLKYYEVTQNNPLIIKLKTSKRQKLYHYTNKIGANGILESNTLWITHSSFLDDTREIKYISFVLDGVITYLKESKELYNIGFEGQFYIYEAIIKTLEAQREIYKQGAPIKGGNLFLLSLSEHKNNKYLIDNYCGQDGAILEFNNIADMFKENEYAVTTYKAQVVYDLGKQITILLKDINEFYLELLNNLAVEKSVDYMEVVETIKSVLYLKVLNYSFFFKHMKYSKEKEYRVVFLLDEDLNSEFLKERIKSGRKNPYIEIKFSKSSLTNVRYI